MNLAELLALIPDENKGEAETFVTGLNTKITNLSDELTEAERKANSSETQSKLDEAIKSRNASKAQLTIVRDTLGLPADKEVTRELVDDYLKDGSKGDAEKDKVISTQRTDIEGLEVLVESLKKGKAESEAREGKVLEESKFIKVFSESMPSFKPASPVARSQIEELLRVNAVLESGEILYKGQDDAYVRVEGERMTMKTRLGQIQDNPDYNYMFETKASGGSGSSNNGSGGGVTKFDQRRRAANI